FGVSYNTDDGTGTAGAGRIIKIENANTASPVATIINAGAGMPSASSVFINCIVTGSNDQNLIACYTNYGLDNVWVTNNGGTSWTACDGNLPNMPVRWALFNPFDDTKAIIATETGIWETDLLNGASTVWTSNTTFPNIRTDMIKYRSSDGTIIAATHGRGIWTATIPVVPGFSFTVPSPATASCPVPATMSLTLGTNSIGGFGNPITLSAISGVPAGTMVTFGTNPVTPSSSSVVTLNNTNTLAAGTYTITIQGTASGAANRTTNVTFTINAGSGPTINTHPVSQAVCDGSNVSFSVDATGTYQWQISTNNGSTWADIGGAIASTYSITGVTVSLNANQYRCVITNSCGSINSNAAVLSVNAPPPTPVITAGGPLSLCTGATVVLTSSSATGNQWYKDGGLISGEINQTYTATTAGSYTVIVTSSGCVSPTSLATVVAVSAPPATPVINWNGSQLSTGTGFASYQWYLNSIIIPMATAATHSPVFSGLYKVTITNAGGCSATSAEFNLVATAVNNLTLNGVQFSLYPNPANKVINIKVNGSNAGKVQLRMISIAGAEMMRIDNISSSASLLVSNYPAGMYYILLNGKKDKGAFKVIIKH
ncbi:MAG: T9SS type A sorting domain-containing protein, partial [Chitinophagaceae bacterium]